MNRSDTIAKLAEAMSKAQGEMKAAIKDSVNPYYKSRYADLASVIECLREPFGRNGLAFTQLPTFDGQNVTVETILLHSSGEWISERLSMPPVERVPGGGVKPRLDPHGIASAITYAKRYALQAMCGLPSDDDDGNAATGQPAEEATRVPAQPAIKPLPPTGLPPEASPVDEAGRHRPVEQLHVDQLVRELTRTGYLAESVCRKAGVQTLAQLNLGWWEFCMEGLAKLPNAVDKQLQEPSRGIEEPE